MTESRKSVTSGLAAFVVVMLVVLVWWLLSGNGPQGPDGNAQRLGGPTPATSAPGTGRVVQLPEPRANGVRIDGFVLEDDRRLALNYTTGVPACAGELDTPEVLETDAAVTVTLTLVPPAEPPDGGCIELALLETVRVDLDIPLGGRAVLDGSFDRPVAVEPALRVNE